MKVGIVTHRVVKGDGQGRVNYEITREAICRGHHVTLIASLVDPDLQQNPQVSWLPVSVKGIPTTFLRNLVFSQRSANLLQKYRSELDIALVNGAITHTPGDVNAVHFVHSAWLRSPAHTWHYRRDPVGLYQLFYTACNAYWEKQAFRQAQALVAVSQQTQAELTALGVPIDQIHLIENGVDLQEFYPGRGERQRYALPEDVPLALFVGDLQTPRKNLDTVLQALVQVPQFHLAIAGKTEGSPYPHLAAQLGVSQRVHFLGYQSQIAEIMRSADVLVFPSRYETFGLVILEAMASGLPIITASTTGAATLLTPAAGFVLDNPDDTQALIEALNCLVNDPHLRQRMGQAARTIAEHHSWATTAQTYVNLFETLTRSKVPQSKPENQRQNQTQNQIQNQIQHQI